MLREGPTLESALNHIARLPPAMWQPLETGGIRPYHGVAAVSDLLARLGLSRLTPEERTTWQRLVYDTGYRKLVLLACWALHQPALRGQANDRKSVLAFLQE